MLRRVALRIEHDAELRAVGLLGADRVIVEVELDFRSGLQQASRSLGEEIAVLADGELVQEVAGVAVAVVAVAVARRVGVDGVGQQVMDDGGVARLALDRLDVAIFGEAGLDVVAAPPVGRFGGHDVLRRGDDQIGLPDVPAIGVVELARLGHVGHVAERRARVDPFHDLCDFVFTKRRIVLEALEADVRIDAPRRHRALGDLLLDRSRPGPDVLVREQRHRRHLPGAMAALTRLLQDRRDVLRERHLLCASRHRDREKDGKEPERFRHQALRSKISAHDAPI